MGLLASAFKLRAQIYSRAAARTHIPACRFEAASPLSDCHPSPEKLRRTRWPRRRRLQFSTRSSRTTPSGLRSRLVHPELLPNRRPTIPDVGWLRTACPHRTSRFHPTLRTLLDVFLRSFHAFVHARIELPRVALPMFSFEAFRPVLLFRFPTPRQT